MAAITPEARGSIHSQTRHTSVGAGRVYCEHRLSCIYSCARVVRSEKLCGCEPIEYHRSRQRSPTGAVFFSNYSRQAPQHPRACCGCCGVGRAMSNPEELLPTIAKNIEGYSDYSVYTAIADNVAEFKPQMAQCVWPCTARFSSSDRRTLFHYL